jgi:hypothetical protein
MALIPVHFTITQSLYIDNTSAVAIPQGSLLAMTGSQDSNGHFLISLHPGTSTVPVVGLAGDNYLFNTNENIGSNIVGINSNDMGYAADLVVGSNGQRVRTMNRINDLYKDTMASSKMTVYSGSGVFRTTRFVSASTYTAGSKVYAAANTNANAGKLDSSATSNVVAGTILEGNRTAGAGGQAFESGVPGTDINGSISLGNFVTFQLGFN